MAYAPVATIAPYFRKFKDYWLKAYEPGTTTPKLLADDTVPTTTFAKLQINVDGFIVSAGGAIITPYIDDAYDAYLFPTEAEADANDTTNAERVANNITGSLNEIQARTLARSYTGYVFNNVADLKSGSLIGGQVVSVEVGNSVKTLGYYSANDGGEAEYIIVAAATGTDDGGTYHDLANGLQAALVEANEQIDPRVYGAKGDGVFDNASALQAIYDANKNIHFNDSGVYYTTQTINLPQFASMTSNFATDQKQPRLKTDNPNIDLLYAEVADTNYIKGIAFEYSVAIGTGRALALKNPNRCKVYDCTIFDAPEGFDFFGEPATSPANNMWVGNFVSKCTGTAMRLYRTHNDFITRNRLESSDICLHMEQTCFDNVVQGNEFSKAVTVGLLTDGNSSGHIISGNVFAVNERDADMGGRGIKFSGNTLKESNNHSVYLNIFRHGVIEGNTFRGVAKDATAGNRYSAIYGNNAIEDCVISGNTFNSEFALTARYCVVIRFSKDNIITGNTMVNGYIDAPILDEFPSGYNDYVDTVSENTPVLFDSSIPDACEPWQAAAGGTISINNPPPIGRLMSISIRNNTGGTLSGVDMDVYNFAGAERITITAADLASIAPAEVRTFRCGAGSRNNSSMATDVAQPAGLQLAYGVSDSYQAFGQVSDVNDILSVADNGTSLTISNFDGTYGSFDVSPSPTIGNSVQVVYNRAKNIV